MGLGPLWPPWALMGPGPLWALMGPGDESPLDDIHAIFEDLKVPPKDPKNLPRTPKTHERALNDSPRTVKGPQRPLNNTLRTLQGPLYVL